MRKRNIFIKTKHSTPPKQDGPLVTAKTISRKITLFFTEIPHHTLLYKIGSALETNELCKLQDPVFLLKLKEPTVNVNQPFMFSQQSTTNPNHTE